MKEIIFSKYSNERSRSFAIRTDIVEEDATHFHIDPALLQELSRDSDQWAALLDQHAK